MSNVENFNTKVSGKDAITQAKLEIKQETMKKSVEALKVKYRELARAQTVVENINREIQDLEIAVEQGNI